MENANLLLNGNWDEGFYSFRDEIDLQVPRGWFPWWLPAEKGAPEWSKHRPLFDSFPIEGQYAQRVRSPNATFVGGLLQQARTVAGEFCTLVAKCQAWSSDTTIPGNLVNPGEVNIQIGIDPTGGTEPESAHVVWSTNYQPLGKWQTLRVEAVAEGPIVTVYLRSALAEPKPQQVVFWCDVRLTADSEQQLAQSIIGPDETTISFEPANPEPGQRVTATVTSARNHVYSDLWLLGQDGRRILPTYKGKDQVKDRHVWRYEFDAPDGGWLEARFAGDEGARLLALETLVVSERSAAVYAAEAPVAEASEPVIEPRQPPSPGYQRVYVLLPPTADRSWSVAAARGGFHGRYTIGFSADDAGLGDFETRYIVAVNPHHWPKTLSAEWFDHFYPGTRFVAVVCTKPADLEQWLRNWVPPRDGSNQA